MGGQKQKGNSVWLTGKWTSERLWQCKGPGAKKQGINRGIRRHHHHLVTEEILCAQVSTR